MRLAFLAGLIAWTTRCFIVNGPDYVQVSPRIFASYANSKSCMRVEVKRYRKERVTVKICEV